MGILGAIGLDDLIGEVGETVRQILPNKEAEREFDIKLREIQDRHQARIHEEILAQVAVNKQEAAHSNIFVAGWRPFIGWVCGAALAWNFVLAPFITSFGAKPGMLNIEYLIMVVGTMLGSSGIRTYEKVRGVVAAEPSGMVAPPPTNLLPPTYHVPTEEENAPWNRM